MSETRLDDKVVAWDDSPEAKEAVFQKVLKYFLGEEAFSGESISQMDSPQVEAIALVCDIADGILKFKVKYDGE